MSPYSTYVTQPPQGNDPSRYGDQRPPGQPGYGPPNQGGQPPYGGQPGFPAGYGQPTPKKKTGLVIGIVVASLLLIGGIVGAIVLLGGDDDNQSSSSVTEDSTTAVTTSTATTSVDPQSPGVPQSTSLEPPNTPDGEAYCQRIRTNADSQELVVP